MGTTVTTANREEIEQAIQTFMLPGQVVELRAMDAVTPSKRYPHTVSGYFNDPEAMLKAATELAGQAPAVFFTLNPVDARLINRACNHVRDADGKKPTTTDKDITRRLWLLIDCDPVRPSDISATDAERNASRGMAKAIIVWLKDSFGFPMPVVADSGNGTHLLYRIDLPVEDTSLIQRMLKAIALWHDTEQAHVDQTVFNAARICKLYGTLAGNKGDNTEERPHRLSKIIIAPKGIHDRPVTREQLEAVAAKLPEEVKSERKGTKASDGPYDMEGLIERHPDKLDAKREGSWQDKGYKWLLECCPFDESHTDNSAVLTLVDGVPGFRCQHNSCAGKGIKDLWELLGEGKKSGQKAKAEPKPRQALPKAHSSSIISLEEVEATTVEWLWQDYIPLGTLSLLDGDPGGGKTMLMADLAGRVTTGQDMPDDTAGVQGGVVFISVEDDLARTIKPRLQAAGADMALVRAIQTVKTLNTETGEITERMFSITTDLHLVEEAISQVNAKLVVIDPIMACLGVELNSYRDQDVRSALVPLIKLAESTGAAVVIVRHLNKGSSENALYRGGGSIGFIGSARAGFMLGRHPDDEEVRVLAPIKNNLGKTPKSLSYRIVANADGIPHIEWEGQCDYRAKDLSAGGAVHSSGQQDILAELKEAAPNELSPAELAELTLQNENTVRSSLKRLVERGAVARSSRGLYTLSTIDKVSKEETRRAQQTQRVQHSHRTQQSQHLPASPDPNVANVADVAVDADGAPTFNSLMRLHPQRADEPRKAYYCRVMRLSAEAHGITSYDRPTSQQRQQLRDFGIDDAEIDRMARDEAKAYLKGREELAAKKPASVAPTPQASSDAFEKDVLADVLSEN